MTQEDTFRPRPATTAARRPAGRKFVVARADDVADGESMIVTVSNRSIGIYNVGGRYHGVLNRCPHRGAELCKGRVSGAISASGPGEYTHDPSTRLLMCPWHGWEFDVTTGQSYFDPDNVRARPFHVDVEEGAIVADAINSGEMVASIDEARIPGNYRPGPYKAEVIDISVEEDYLVVNLRPTITRMASGTPKEEQ